MSETTVESMTITSSPIATSALHYKLETEIPADDPSRAAADAAMATIAQVLKAAGAFMDGPGWCLKRVSASEVSFELPAAEREACRDLLGRLLADPKETQAKKLLRLIDEQLGP